ncbi:MAG TPA: hypothetical protein VGW34_13900, partial [Allosphingosinicella sp.]|nr:hypothetical protein [Allosphingosinicella sp.]
MRALSSKSTASPFKFASLALLGSTMLCTTGTAFAQDTGDPTGADVASGDPSGADDIADSGRGQDDEAEIIITAQKREENLQDVPIAVTALGTEKLDELQVTDFDDYARYIPS